MRYNLMQNGGPYNEAYKSLMRARYKIWRCCDCEVHAKIRR